LQNKDFIDVNKELKQGLACFAAGTLVHTKEGSVPIEQIKVGDYVLSKPESGEGEQAYKRVTQVFAHKPTRVIRMNYIPDESQQIAHNITTTLNHPFWVTGKGWTKAQDLKGTESGKGQKLELCDGRKVPVFNNANIYISDQSGVGWLSSTSDGLTSRPGALWDFLNHRLVATQVAPLKDFKDIIENELEDNTNAFYLKLPVYNLEVEDFHTYYVGKHGVWVHNKNGTGLEISVRGTQTKLTEDMLPFFSRKELLSYLDIYRAALRTIQNVRASQT